MTAEECVLLAVALDFHAGMAQPPLLYDQIKEVSILEDKSMNVVRILVVTAQRNTSRVSFKRIQQDTENSDV